MKNTYFLILILTGILFVSPQANPFPSQTMTIPLGGIFPLTGALAAGGVERHAAYLMAIDEINENTSFLPGVTIKPEVRNSATDIGTGKAAASELVGLGVVGIVGAASSRVSMAIQEVAAQSKIPQISYSSTLPDLSNKSLYPYFMRVVYPYNVAMYTLADVINASGIGEIALVVNEFYLVSVDELMDFWSYPMNLTFKTVQVTQAYAANYDVQVQAIKDSNVSSIVIIGYNSTGIYSSLLDAGIGWDKQLITMFQDVRYSDSLLDPLRHSNNSLEENTIVIYHSQYQGARYQHFLDIWESCLGQSPAVYTGCGDRTPNMFAFNAYDAVYAFAYAFEKMIADEVDITDGPSLLKYLYMTDFVGSIGRIRFNENGDRIAQFDIYQIRKKEQVYATRWTEGEPLDTSNIRFLPPAVDVTTTTPVTTTTLVTTTTQSSNSELTSPSLSNPIPFFVPYVIFVPLSLLSRRKKT